MSLRLNVFHCKRVNGKAVFSTFRCKKGEVAFTLEGEVFNTSSRESIHIGNNKHIIDKWGIYMNHSFQPNTKIVGKDVVAVKDIEYGDELSFNYNDSELPMHSPFTVDGVEVKGRESNVNS